MTATASARGDLAEQMLPIAAKLACIVHGDGGAADIAHLTNTLDRTELTAVIVTLAALVNPDQRLDQALNHITWDEHGRPADAPRDTRTIRQLTTRRDFPAPPSGADAVMESEMKNRAREWIAQGLTAVDVAKRLGVHERTVTRWKTAGGWPSPQQYPSRGKRQPGEVAA